MGTIYKITHSENNLVYIGQTTLPLAQRWNKHKSAARKYGLHKGDIPGKRGTCSKLYDAMCTYGIDKFEITVLEMVSVDQIDEREIHYIKSFNSIYPAGYNQTTGGGHFEHSEETKQRISENTIKGIAANIDSYRKNEQSIGLPVHMLYTQVKGVDAIAINKYRSSTGEMLCDWKTFTLNEFETLESAIEAAKIFIAQLETTGIKYEPVKAGENLRKGIQKKPNGYLVRKIINGKIITKKFMNSKLTDEQKLKMANAYLDSLLKT